MSKTSFKIALVIVLTMAASSAYSASTSLSGANLSVGGNTFSASNKVFIGVSTNATNSASFDGTSYCATSVHGSGDKLLMGAAGDSRLFYKTIGVGQTAAVDPGGTALPTLTGWTSM